MANDKIFNNTFGEQDMSAEMITFKISPAFESNLDGDDQMHYDLLFEKIDDIIKGSEFEHLNEVTSTGVSKKLNKVQINKVFSFVLTTLGKDYSRVDVFGVLSDYFDVFPNKFYNSLSNKFKDELISELDEKYDILKKKKINKLF
jgi:hypothetical protein